MARRTLLWMVLVMALIAALPGCNVTPTTTTSPGEAKALVEGGALLVDVRTVEEYQAGHIEGAVNIPLSDLESRLGELTPPTEPIVLYCRSGSRSGQAGHLLEQRGFTRVHNLGPMSAWK